MSAKEDRAADASLDTEESNGAIVELLGEVKAYLERTATDREGQKLLGKVELALAHWFEEVGDTGPDDGQDEDEEEEDDEDDDWDEDDEEDWGSDDEDEDEEEDEGEGEDEGEEDDEDEGLED